ncbi:hypothetical protein, partial [Pseudomonas alvandae]|uniref:hypothetical protein n=1 Tax=Pseudomonas canavaninivorans TaxID=2842348 RepID=UPI002B1DCC8B
HDAVFRGASLDPQVSLDDLLERVQQFIRQGIVPFEREGTRDQWNQQISSFDPTPRVRASEPPQ